MKTNIIKYQFEFELINTNMLVNSAFLLPTFIAGIVLNFTILGDISMCIYLVQ